jgi:hypothetical protein
MRAGWRGPKPGSRRAPPDRDHAAEAIPPGAQWRRAWSPRQYRMGPDHSESTTRRATAESAAVIRSQRPCHDRPYISIE